MKKLTKILLIMLIAGIFAFLVRTNVYAGTISVTPNGGTFTLGLGETMSVSATGDYATGSIIVNSSNPDVVSVYSSEGDNLLWPDDGKTDSLTLQAISYGESIIEIIPDSVGGYDSKPIENEIKCSFIVIVPEPVTEAPTEAPEPVTEAPEPVYVEPETEQYYEPEPQQYYEPETEQYYAPETEPEVVEVWTEEETESETEESSSETTESTTMETTTKETTSETTTAETIEETAEGDETASDSENGYKAPGGTGIPLLIAVCVVIAGILVFNYLLVWRHKK